MFSYAWKILITVNILVHNLFSPATVETVILSGVKIPVKISEANAEKSSLTGFTEGSEEEQKVCAGKLLPPAR